MYYATHPPNRSMAFPVTLTRDAIVDRHGKSVRHRDESARVVETASRIPAELGVRPFRLAPTSHTIPVRFHVPLQRLLGSVCESYLCGLPASQSVSPTAHDDDDLPFDLPLAPCYARRAITPRPGLPRCESYWTVVVRMHRCRVYPPRAASGKGPSLMPSRAWLSASTYLRQPSSRAGTHSSTPRARPSRRRRLRRAPPHPTAARVEHTPSSQTSCHTSSSPSPSAARSARRRAS